MALAHPCTTVCFFPLLVHMLLSVASQAFIEHLLLARFCAGQWVGAVIQQGLRLMNSPLIHREPGPSWALNSRESLSPLHLPEGQDGPIRFP